MLLTENSCVAWPVDVFWRVLPNFAAVIFIDRGGITMLSTLVLCLKYDVITAGVDVFDRSKLKKIFACVHGSGVYA